MIETINDSNKAISENKISKYIKWWIASLIILLSTSCSENTEWKIVYKWDRWNSPRTESYTYHLTNNKWKTLENLNIILECKNTPFGHFYRYKINEIEIIDNHLMSWSRDADKMKNNTKVRLSDYIKKFWLSEKEEQEKLNEISNILEYITKDMKYKMWETDETGTIKYVWSVRDSAYNRHSYNEVIQISKK